MNCIFCDISNKKANAEVIYETENVISFLDINPLNLGHTLVIPKSHYEDFFSVPPGELEKVIKAAQIVFNAIKSSLNPDGINLVSNNGIAAGQSVFHFHMHVIPRYKSDNFRFKPEFKKYNNNSMKEFAEKIRLAVTT